MSEPQWLHLFSSSIRELYIADVVDLLAAPAGFVYQFRYGAEHVQDQARDRWHGGAGGLHGANVIVYYSMQHAANFHPAAYLPIRIGEVVDAFVEGRTHVVRFKLGDYAPLADPTDGRLDTFVHEFTAAVRDMLASDTPDHAVPGAGGRDLRRSAALGPTPEPLLDLDGGESARFERTVHYLSRALGPQHPRLFYRISSIWKGERGTNRISLADDGYLDLTAGNHFTVEVAHFQPEPTAPGGIEITAPPGVELLSGTQLAVRSRYDVMPVRVFAPFRDNEVQGELTFQVPEPAQGATVRLPVRIRPSATHAVAYPALAIIGTMSVATPAILGSDAPLEPRLLLAALGAVLVGLAAWARKSKGLA